MSEQIGIPGAEYILEIRRLIERNAKLVAALELFADSDNWLRDGRFDPNSGNFDGLSVASEALQQSTEKP